jgi:hypothetical protein
MGAPLLSIGRVGVRGGVKVMAASVGLAAMLAAPARGDLRNIADLYNTGVDNAGFSLPAGAPDAHFTFATPPPSGTAPLVATSTTGFPVAPGGPWLGDSPTSAWLVPTPNTTGNAGDYLYRTTFTLPGNVDLSQVYLAGHWASDNDGRDILINGVSTGTFNNLGFSAYSPQWAIQRGFKTGLNTLDFVVNEATGSENNGGFTGLRVEMGGKYAAPAAGRVAIASLRNSGAVAPKGAAMPDRTVDPGVVLNPQSTVIAPVLTKTGASGFPVPPWTPDSIYSTWLVPSLDTNAPEGDYYYETTFNLTGLKPETAEIYGRWATDNDGVDVLLNGVPTGNPTLNQFADWTDFTLSAATGETFLPGINTLTFLVHNQPVSPNPTGVRFEFLSGTAQAVPEPGAFGMLTVCAIAAALRRRARATD